MNATVSSALNRTFSTTTARNTAHVQAALYGRSSGLASQDSYALIAWAKNHYGTASAAALLGPPPANLDSKRSVARQLLTELIRRHDEIADDQDASWLRLRDDLGYAATLAEVALVTWEAIQAA